MGIVKYGDGKRIFLAGVELNIIVVSGIKLAGHHQGPFLVLPDAFCFYICNTVFKKKRWIKYENMFLLKA